MNKTQFSSMTLALLLAACGGGGGGSPAPVAVTPPPTTTPVVTAGNLLMTMPANPYPSGSADARTFDDLNRIRIAGGFGAAVEDPVMRQAAANHDAYAYVNNLGSTPHAETPGLTGFTGVTPSDRCIAAAIGTAEAGNIACGEDRVGAGVSASNLDVMGIYAYATGHLQNILDYTNNRVGMHLGDWPDATPTNPDSGGTIDFGNVPGLQAKLASDKLHSIVGVYPFDGMTNVRIGINGYAGPTLGYVIQGTSILVQTSMGGTNPLVTTFTLRKEGATSDTPVTIYEAGRPIGPEETSPGWAILMPTVLLDVNSKYNVTFIGTILGTPIQKTWSFTTGTTGAF